MTFVTGGDPSVSHLASILEALQEGGADVIEVGLPFSDPIADGPVIQASSYRALSAGATRHGILHALQSARLNVPVVLMGYYNTMLRPGLRAFAEEAKASGVAGTIVCDAIPEEAAEWVELSRGLGLDTIFLAAPTSTPARLDAVAAQSSGFVYAVSRTGVTGAALTQEDQTLRLVNDLKARTPTPVCVGFGVSTPAQVRSMAAVADGVVVGSSLVTLVHEQWEDGSGRADVVDYVRTLKAATRG